MHSARPAADETASPLVPSATLPVPVIPDHELLRLIGTGSYGEVWLARTLVGTLRAVKVIYRRTFEQEQHFEREFRGLQKFEPVSRSHEGLVDVLQIGRNDEGGYFYYVMELADDANADRGTQSAESNEVGRDVLIAPRRAEDSPPYRPKTLRSEQRRFGRIPVSDCLDIALALTDALAHLHAHGLVHRDIKPSNIIFVDGKPKLADIGLVADISEARSFVGTTGFIPPEGPGKAQADLYSLGKVLYEISTGKDRQEFPSLPPNLRELPDADALIEFNEIVVKACDDNPRERYAAAETMRADLAHLREGRSIIRKHSWHRFTSRALRLGAAAAALAALLAAGWLFHSRFNTSTVQLINGVPEMNSIAVLPFVNESTNADYQYLSHAISDETMNALTNCAGLRVASRASVFAFGRITNDLQAIGKQLGVRTVLAGNLNRSSNWFYVTAARLINVADNSTLWSATYDHYRSSSNTRDVALQVVTNVAQVLNVSFPDSALRQMETNFARKLAAYRLFTRAISLPRNTMESFTEASELLNRAVLADPEFASAYAHLADFYAQSAGHLPARQAMPEARNHAMRALQLNDSLALPHMTLGMILGYYELDFDGAEAAFKRALQINSKDSRPLANYAHFLAMRGRFRDADVLLQEARESDPKGQIVLATTAWRNFRERKFDEMLRQSVQLQSLYPNDVVANEALATAYVHVGDFAKALATIERARQISAAPEVLSTVGYVQALAGERRAAQKTLEQLNAMAPSRHVAHVYLAWIYGALGEVSQAVEQLEKAHAEGEGSVHPTFLQFSPEFDRVRDDPRFKAMIERMELEK